MVDDGRPTRRTVLASGLCLALPGLAKAAASRLSDRHRVPPRLAVIGLLPTELVLTLGVAPVAIGNLPLYRRLVSEPPPPDGVADTGPLLEPNLELLQHLAPDHIICAGWQEGALRPLDRIAPVTWMETTPTGTPPLAHMTTLFETIAALTGRPAKARTAMAQLRTALDVATDALASRADRPIFVVRFMEDGRHAAVFGRRGMVGAVLARLGLTNAWTGDGNAWGTAVIGIEDLARQPEATVVHFDRGAETARALAKLSESRLWQALPAVRAGRVVAMPVVYPNGGIASATRFARQIQAGLGAAEGSRA